MALPLTSCVQLLKLSVLSLLVYKWDDSSYLTDVLERRSEMIHVSYFEQWLACCQFSVNVVVAITAAVTTVIIIFARLGPVGVD